jgi:hydrogenase maturation factor
VKTRLYPAGKLPPRDLERLLRAYTHRDARLVVPPGVGVDAAVLDFGDRYLVAKTDPITFATDAIGWYAVHVNANDVASMGAQPRFFLAAVLLPPDQATADQVERIFRSIHEAADSLGVLVCGGHTEITPGIDRPIVVGHMLGEVEPNRLVRPSGLRPGDALLLTKGLGIEATALIARERGPQLRRKGYGEDVIEQCRNFLYDPGISVVRDARVAIAAGQVRALHDPTEGGVATGISELATASGVGIEVFAEAMPIAPATARLCAEFGLDPLGVISSGALLIGCDPDSAAPILAALAEFGIAAARIGQAHPPGFGVRLRREGELVPLPCFAADEITRLFED